MLLALYEKVLKEEDKFILSKAHACPALNTVLADRGYFSMGDLSSFRKIDSHLQGHTKIGTPGVEMSGGSLGQGLSFGLGTTLAGQMDKRDYRTYVLLGDGECDEGQIWEAAMAAAHYKVDNLTAIVDRNGIQNDRWTKEVMNLEPLPYKWRSFGWNSIEIDGHKMTEILSAFREAANIKGKPTVIVAKTTKGKGVSFMENNPAFHGSPPNKEQYDKAL